MRNRFCSFVTFMLVAFAINVISSAQDFDIEQLPVQNGADAQAGGGFGDDINIFGHVAGRRTLTDGDGNIGRAYLWNGQQAFDIGTAGQPSFLAGSNDLDQVVVTEVIPDDFFVQTNAYFWDNGTQTSIGSLGGTNTFPVDINNNGKVVGFSTINGPFGQRAFLWTEAGGIRNLGGPADIIESKALDINELDQVAGYTFVSDAVGIVGFFWSDETGLVDIGPIDRNGFLGINDNSQMAGMQRNADATISWFRCQVNIADDGTVSCSRENLVEFGDANEFRVLNPLGMNNCGQVLGIASNTAPGFDVRLAIWEPDGSVTLQPDVWDSISSATINDSGHVVFNGFLDFNSSAYFWDPGMGSTVRLPTLSGNGANVSDLNAFDELSGGSRDFDGLIRAVVWRPLGPLPDGSADLLALIETLKERYADGSLFEGDFVSLLAKLTAADAQLRAGNTQAAKGVLQSAQNQIDQLIRNVFIPAAVGAELIAAIDEILSQL